MRALVVCDAQISVKISVKMIREEDWLSWTLGRMEECFYWCRE
jgi:hypothetical protein